MRFRPGQFISATYSYNLIRQYFREREKKASVCPPLRLSPVSMSRWATVKLSVAASPFMVSTCLIIPVAWSPGWGTGRGFCSHGYSDNRPLRNRIRLGLSHMHSVFIRCGQNSQNYQGCFSWHRRMPRLSTTSSTAKRQNISLRAAVLGPLLFLV